MSLCLVAGPRWANAKGSGSSGGLTLLQSPTARTASLADAYTASYDDVAGMVYNPSALATLRSAEATLLYQQGLTRDVYGQFMLGGPTAHGALGLSVGYYNAGSVDVFDGTTDRTVNAQTDMTVGLGYARNLGMTSVGVTAKYLSSTLIETAKARAFAMDAGVGFQPASRLRLGAAIQNYGQKMTYISEGDNLPRILRAGLSYLLLPGRFATTLFLDAPYFVNEQELRPALAFETRVGPLAFRLGYKKRTGLQEFTLGAGFTIGPSSLDYSFGMVDKLDSIQQLSLAFRFGGPAAGPVISAVPPKAEHPVLVAPPPENTHKHALEETYRDPGPGARVQRTYIVQKGDTLGEIALRQYGDRRNWKLIYDANRDVLDDPHGLREGQRLVLPAVTGKGAPDH